MLVAIGAVQHHAPAPWALVALIVARELVLIPLAIRYVLRKLPAAVRADIGHVG